MKRIVGLLILSLILSPVIGQTVKPKISFENNTHSFGNFREADGKVTHQFQFINTGGSDIIIQNVTASCGCTAPKWTQEPIPPGGKGFVAATFNPAGRPGPFRKYITVISILIIHILRLSERVTGREWCPWARKQSVY